VEFWKTVLKAILLILSKKLSAHSVRDCLLVCVGLHGVLRNVQFAHFLHLFSSQSKFDAPGGGEISESDVAQGTKIRAYG
jgi:hypothetical protein